MASRAANRMETFVRKSFTKSMRTREKNDTYDEMLEQSINHLAAKHQKKTTHINSEIKKLALSLKHAGVKEINVSVSLPNSEASSRCQTPDPPKMKNRPSGMKSLPELYHSITPTHNYDRGSSASSEVSHRYRSAIASKYKRKLRSSSKVSFDAPTPRCAFIAKTSTDCVHFPCVTPSTYHSVGYESEGKVITRTKPMSAASKRRLYSSLEATTTRRPVRSNLSNKVKIREMGLTKQVSHMRYKNELTKPTEWCINYGKPTPLRKVLKPARPSDIV